jgi:hypothetical protein
VSRTRSATCLIAAVSASTRCESRFSISLEVNELRLRRWAEGQVFFVLVCEC